MSERLPGPRGRGIAAPDPEVRARLEAQLLAEFDRKLARPAPRHARRYLTAAVLVASLLFATQVPAEYAVEVGKRISFVAPSALARQERWGEKMAQALGPERSRVDVQVQMRRWPGGEGQVIVDVWGDRLIADEEVPGAVRAAIPELASTPIEVTAISGRVRDNLIGKLGHALFRRDASPEELEQARQRVIEELRRAEGEGTQIDLQIEPGSEGNRVRLKVRKQIEQ